MRRYQVRLAGALRRREVAGARAAVVHDRHYPGGHARPHVRQGEHGGRVLRTGERGHGGEGETCEGLCFAFLPSFFFSSFFSSRSTKFDVLLRQRYALVYVLHVQVHDCARVYVSALLLFK